MIAAYTQHAPLGTGNEKRTCRMHCVKAKEIHIASVHDVESSRLCGEDIQNVDIVQFASGNADELGDAPSEVQQSMQFDRSFRLTEMSPWEKGSAQINGR